MASVHPVSGALSVRYAQTSDGAQIAYSVAGAGRTTVYMPLVPWVTLGMVAPLRKLIHGENSSRDSGQRSVLYDVRGGGMSPGAGLDLSLEAQVADLEAVIEAIADGPVVLIAPLHAGPAGIAYAARHPDRLSALVLWGSSARGADYFEHPRLKALFAVVTQNWEVFTDSSGMALLGSQQPAASSALSELIRDALEPEAADAALRTLASLDVTPILGEVRVPTLVVGRLSAVPSTEVVRELARAIPGGRLALARGSALSPLLGDSAEANGAIEQFLDDVLGTAAAAPVVSPAEQSVARPIEGVEPLTGREREALGLVAEGMTNDEIASRLGVSISTVKKHVHNASSKLGTRNRAQAATRARELGLLS